MKDGGMLPEYVTQQEHVMTCAVLNCDRYSYAVFAGFSACEEHYLEMLWNSQHQLIVGHHEYVNQLMDLVMRRIAGDYAGLGIEFLREQMRQRALMR